MYFTDDSVLPENQQPLIICAAPLYEPQSRRHPSPHPCRDGILACQFWPRNWRESRLWDEEEI